MAYYMVRLYSGSGDRPPEQLLRDVVEPQLHPKLKAVGGLNRYITFIADDGRIGSASVYQNKSDGERGLNVAREVVSVTDAMKGYQFSRIFEGEIAETLNANAEYEPRFGMARIFPTSATAAEVVETIKKSRAGAQDDAARPRTVIVQLDGGRVGSFAAYDFEESRDRHTAAIAKAREIPEHKRVLPNDAELIPVRIITSSGR